MLRNRPFLDLCRCQCPRGEAEFKPGSRTILPCELRGARREATPYTDPAGVSHGRVVLPLLLWRRGLGRGGSSLFSGQWFVGNPTAHSHAVCSLRGLPQRLLRLEPAPNPTRSPRPRQRAALGAGLPDPPGQPQDLWQPPHSSRTGQSRSRSWSQPHCPLNAPARPLWPRQRPVPGPHHRQRPRPAHCPQSLGATTCPQRPQPNLGRRHHLHPHRRRLALSGRRHGPLQPTDRRLGHGPKHRHPTHSGRLGDIPAGCGTNHSGVLAENDNLLSLPLSSKGGEGNGASVSEHRAACKEQANGAPSPQGLG